MSHDYYVDMFEVIHGNPVVFNSKNPDKTWPVVELLTAQCETTSDPEEAVGGIVQFAEECFVTFMWGT